MGLILGVIWLCLVLWFAYALFKTWKHLKPEREEN